MTNEPLAAKIDQALDRIETLRTKYGQNAEDQVISGGNVAICIIDENGTVYGRMYGPDKSRLRHSYKIAWIKASQVWLTGVRTGEYERLVFNRLVEENANGIEAPDLIGWEGGQPITLLSGETLSIGFSGFRGSSDLQIVTDAFFQL